MDALEVEPGIGIGPVRIGMTRQEVITVADAGGMDVRSVRRWPGRPEVLVIGDQVQAYFGPNDVVEQVESSMSPTPVRYGAIDLGGRAADVKAALAGIAEPDTRDPEFPASFCYPSLGLCLWQDAKASDWRQEEPYDSVLVQAVGLNLMTQAPERRRPSAYGSLPEEARAERLQSMAMRWGIGDDIERERAVQYASDTELAELATCLDHVPDRFWEWLAGPESFSPEPSETYVQMSALVAAVDSARARLSASGQ